MTKTLLDMPDVAMTEIMSYLDYRSIQNTRKTCWKLRYFFEAVQFNPRIYSIQLFEDRDRVEAVLDFEKVWNDENVWNVEDERLQYLAHKDGCEVTWQHRRNQKKVTLMKNERYRDAFWRDLKVLLTNDRTTLEKFYVFTNNSIYRNDFAIQLEEMLKQRKEAIQVKDIIIDAFNPNEVAQILQCFDSKSLNQLVMNNTQSEDAVMDISEIVRLDHWKQTKNIKMSSWRFPSAQMQHFAHFQICEIFSTDFVGHKIKIVKEMYLQSTDYVKTVYFYTNFYLHQDTILRALERNIDLLEETREFYFNTKHNSNKVLCVNVNILNVGTNGDCVTFYFMEKSTVPSDVEISS